MLPLLKFCADGQEHTNRQAIDALSQEFGLTEDEQKQLLPKGIFITTSDFSQGAHEYVAAIESKIILIDGQELAQLMIDFGVGVATDATYELKRLDSDYFTET